MGKEKNNSDVYDDVENPTMAVSKQHYPVMEDHEVECGIGACRPKSLQRLSNMPCFTAVFCLSSTVTSVLTLFLTSQITTLERHFGLNSTQSGFLLSCNDIGFLLMTLFVSYTARRIHIPRALSVSAAIYGIGGFICALAYVFDPYKLQKLYQALDPHSNNGSGESHTLMCSLQQIVIQSVYKNTSVSMNETQCIEGQPVQHKAGVATDFTFWAVLIMAIGMMLQGFAKAPRYPYVTTFVDDNVEKTKTAMYVGVIMGLSIFGPAIAFTTGGLFNKIYVTLHDVAISHRDPRWIGAWWLGFVIYGVIAIVLAIPLFFFPRRMTLKAKMADAWKPDGKGLKQYKGLVAAVIGLLKNPVYILVVLAGNISLLCISGTVSYAPKYLETQFSIPTWKANVLLGVIHVSAASLGTVIGGVLTSKLKLHPVTCLKFVIIGKLCSVFWAGLAYVLGCSNPEIVGYNFNTSRLTEPIGNESNWRCGQTCGCQNNEFFPVCGSDGLNYLSPCIAGCTEGTNETFTNCFCIGENSTATPGLCDTGCDMLIPYLAGSSLSGLISTMTIMPAFILQIRSISDRDKAIAIGLASFLNTLVGWLPGPVIMGQIIDTVCDVWNSSCDQNGSCALYNIVDFRFKYLLFQGGMMFLSLILYCVSFVKAKKKTDWSTDETDKNQNLPEGEKLMGESQNGFALKEYDKHKSDN